MILGPEQKIILCNCIVSKFLNKSWEYIIILKYRVSDQTNTSECDWSNLHTSFSICRLRQQGILKIIFIEFYTNKIII